jgi:hypothetical protein
LWHAPRVTEQQDQPGVLVTVATVWPDVDETPVLAVNQFLTQLAGGTPDRAPNEVILTCGHFTPPVILGTPEQQKAAVEKVIEARVRTVARFSVPRPVLSDLIRILNIAAESYDAAQESEAGDRDA